jgi:hypothetical protein
MEYSLLGQSGVKVSKICLGTATFGVAPDAQEAGRVVHAALGSTRQLGCRAGTSSIRSNSACAA